MGFGGFDAGSIVGHLVLDKQQWTQTITAARQDLKDFQKSVKLKSDEIQAAGRILATFGASVTATFGLLIKSSADAGDQINDLSKSTGISTELLSGYRLAADKSGTSVEGFAIGIKTLANQMQSAITRGGASREIFDSLGVSYKDNAGKLRPLGQVMLDVADRFKSMENGADKSALAVDLFGKSGQELIPMLNLGREGLEREYAAAERLGLVFSKDAAQGADDFNDSLVELRGAVQGVANELGKTLLPALQPLVDRARNTISLVREFIKEYPALATSLAETGIGIGVVAGVLGTVCMMLPSFLKGWTILIPVLAAAAPVIVTIGTALAAWNLGRYIGEVTGLDKTYQAAFTSLFKFLGVIKETNIEFGAGHAAAYAIQTEAIARATEMSGKKVSGFIEAQRILRRQFQDTGTVGNATLDAWLAKLPPLKIKTDDLSGGVGDLRIMIEKLKVPIIDAVAEFEKMGNTSLDDLIADIIRLDALSRIVEIEPQFKTDTFLSDVDIASDTLDEFLAKAAAAGAALSDQATKDAQALMAEYDQVAGGVVSAFTSIMEGSKTMGEFFSSIVTAMIGDIGKLVVAELIATNKIIIAKKMASVADAISGIFKSLPWFVALPLAAGAFAVVSKLFSKLLKFEEGGVFKQPTIAEVGHGTEYVLPEKKLIRIVQDALGGGGGGPMSPQLAFAGAGAAMGGPTINIHQTLNVQSLDGRTVREASDLIWEQVELQAWKRGWRIKRA